MRSAETHNAVELFSTCPPASDCSQDEYPARVREAARWSDAAGCTGMLVYTDNRQLDPWLVAHTIVQETERLAPLVAVQPVYSHPFTIAKQIATLGYLFERRVHLNMVAGGFKGDLEALDDRTPHDARYDRLIEYTTIVMRLLAGEKPVTYEGRFYRTTGLKMFPSLREDLVPNLLLSGSSDAGLAAARTLGATAVRYPRSPKEERETSAAADVPVGFRVGIIARDTSEKAWREAHARFPGDRRGMLLHQMAMKVSDSQWHRQLSEAEPGDGPYWMFPFQNYKTFCPYLVGSYEEIAAELSTFLSLGARTFILDVPRSEEDLEHVNRAFELSIGVAIS